MILDPEMLHDPAAIDRILGYARIIAVVGLSSNASRPSFRVAKYLLDHGFTIIPVNPGETSVLGQTAYPRLADIPVAVDVVDVFRAADAVPEIARDAVKIGARALWIQSGIVSHDGADIAAKAGMDIVMDRCLMVEHEMYALRVATRARMMKNASSAPDSAVSGS